MAGSQPKNPPIGEPPGTPKTAVLRKGGRTLIQLFFMWNPPIFFWEKIGPDIILGSVWKWAIHQIWLPYLKSVWRFFLGKMMIIPLEWGIAMDSLSSDNAAETWFSIGGDPRSLTAPRAPRAPTTPSSVAVRLRTFSKERTADVQTGTHRKMWWWYCGWASEIRITSW